MYYYIIQYTISLALFVLPYLYRIIYAILAMAIVRFHKSVAICDNNNMLRARRRRFWFHFTFAHAASTRSVHVYARRTIDCLDPLNRNHQVRYFYGVSMKINFQIHFSVVYMYIYIPIYMTYIFVRILFIFVSTNLPICYYCIQTLHRPVW